MEGAGCTRASTLGTAAGSSIKEKGASVGAFIVRRHRQCAHSFLSARNIIRSSQINGTIGANARERHMR